jgi:hypothetical protein
VLQLARCLLQLLNSLSQQQQQQQQQQLKTPSRGSGGSSSSHIAGSDAAAGEGTPASAVPADPRQQQYSTASQLLQQLFLQAPASFVALDCLLQLCKALLGPSGAHALLHGRYAPCSSSSSTSPMRQQQPGAAAAEVAECLQAVVGTARRLAAAVSPR